MKKELINSKSERWGKRATILCMVAFSLYSLACVIYCAVQKEYSLMTRGLFFPLFLLIPLLFRWIHLQHPWRLYCLLYLFLMFAYSFGCVFGAFTKMDYMDKISHFASGFVFTILGFCLYYWQAGAKPGGLLQDWTLAAGYALFFSAFIALMWEVCEYFDFALFGNDSQNHLTTGVFDTMHDLMACLAASLLSVGAFALFRFTKCKLLTAFVVEEFYDKNARAAGQAQKAAGHKDTGG